MKFELMTHEVGRMTVAELAIFFSDMTRTLTQAVGLPPAPPHPLEGAAPQRPPEFDALGQD